MAYKNIEDKKKYQRQYCQKNREAIREYNKRYYQEHKEEKVESYREYYRKNRERILVRQKRWTIKNYMKGSDPVILTEIRDFIENNYRDKVNSQLSSYKYIQGYLDSLKKYNVISLRDFHELGNYNQEIYEHSLDVQVKRVKENAGRYIKLPKEG
jgi:hypothetical protein